MPRTRSNEARWIEKRQRWQINVQHDGERKTFTSSLAGKKGKIAAEKAADAWLAAGAKKTQNIRLLSLWQDFLAEMQIASPGGWRQLKSNGETWILPRLQHRRLNTITAQDWQDCINAAHQAQKSRKTCKNIRGAITRLCRYAKKNGLELAPPEDVYIPQDAAVKPKSILQPAELQQLFRHDTVLVRGREQAAFFIHAWRFMVLTGLRRGELVGLRQEDIRQGLMLVQRSVNQFGEITSGKTPNARRGMVLPQRARQVLNAQAAMLRALGIESPWVFPDESGNLLDPNRLYSKWVSYRSQHGISSSLHELRHTMISISKADVPEQLLKLAVGHAPSMDTFGVYGHEVQGEMQRVAEILDEVYDRLLDQS